MRLAIFDYNGTIFPRETLKFLLNEWRRMGYSRLQYYRIYLSVIPLYLRYKLGFNLSLTKEEMERMAVDKFSRIFRGMEEGEIIEFFTGAEETARRDYNQELIAEVEKAIQEKYHTVLLSGAFRRFLEQVAAGLTIETVIGSEIHISNDKLDPVAGVSTISGSDKLSNLKERFTADNIDWGKSRAYADSIHDLPLLKAVGEPVAVDPDLELKEIAIERDWQIIYTN